MDLSSINSGAALAFAPALSPVPADVAQERRNVIQAVSAVNEAELFGSQNELAFSIDRVTKRPVVKIIDRQTREVVDQIPNEHVLRMAEEIK